MKTAIAITAAVSLLTIAPGLAVAKDITGRLTQKQIDNYCAAGPNTQGGNATFDLGHGKMASGTVDCSAAGSPSLSATSGADDQGMKSESANDADSSHED